MPWLWTLGTLAPRISLAMKLFARVVIFLDGIMMKKKHHSCEKFWGEWRFGSRCPSVHGIFIAYLLVFVSAPSLTSLTGSDDYDYLLAATPRHFSSAGLAWLSRMHFSSAGLAWL